MKYNVNIREIHVSIVEVEAKNPADAIEKAKAAIEDGVDDLFTEYSHTLDEDTWTVEEAK